MAVREMGIGGTPQLAAAPVGAGNILFGQAGGSGRLDDSDLLDWDGTRLSANADVASTHALGQSRIGSIADVALFGHFDQFADTTGAVRVTALGATRVQAVAGQTVDFRVGTLTGGQFDDVGGVFKFVPVGAGKDIGGSGDRWDDVFATTINAGNVIVNAGGVNQNGTNAGMDLIARRAAGDVGPTADFDLVAVNTRTAGNLLRLTHANGATLRFAINFAGDVNLIGALDHDGATAGFYGVAPVARGAAVADAAGGVTIDTEARAALNALLARIRAIGIILP